MKVFDTHKDRFCRIAQEGMVRAQDLPTALNVSETKRSLGLALKADIKKSMDVISKTMIDLLTGLEDIFMDPMNLNDAETRSMDLVLGSKLILKFFTSLSRSSEGLLNLIEDIRIWEKSAPSIRKDQLNALIVALKNLKEPVLAGTVIRIVQEGLPTRMDSLIKHLTDSLSQELGGLDLVTVSAWNHLASKSSIEISDTTLVNPTPVATSSASNLLQPQSTNQTRITLDRLKAKFRDATDALSK